MTAPQIDYGPNIRIVPAMSARRAPTASRHAGRRRRMAHLRGATHTFVRRSARRIRLAPRRHRNACARRDPAWRHFAPTISRRKLFLVAHLGPDAHLANRARDRRPHRPISKICSGGCARAAKRCAAGWTARAAIWISGAARTESRAARPSIFALPVASPFGFGRIWRPMSTDRPGGFTERESPT